MGKFFEDVANVIETHKVSIMEKESSVQKLTFSKTQKESHFRNGTWLEALQLDQHRDG